MLRQIAIPVVFALVSLALGQLQFSEYVEGSGHNKGLEILNAGAESIDFDGLGCRVRMYFNGHMEPELEIQLHGRLPPGDVLVLYHEQGDNPAFLEAVRSAKHAQAGGFGWFNGNDAIELACGSQVVDELGERGSADEWGKDQTRRRVGGTWRELEQNTFDGLGMP